MPTSANSCSSPPLPADPHLRLAVIIPVYNRRALVLEALASVRAQTVAPWRVVVVDDGSVDGSADAVEAWLAEHPLSCPVRVVRQPNAGVAAARNAGVEEAKGAELLAFLDSDDLWPADFVEKAIATFKEKPQLVAASADSVVCQHDGQGRLTGQVDKPWRGAGIRAVRAVHRHYPGTPATVVRALFFRYLGGFPRGLQLGEDAVFFLLLSMQGEWGRIASRPVTYRYFQSEADGADAGHLSSLRSPEILHRFACVLDSKAADFHCVSALLPAITHRWRRAGKAMKGAGRLPEARACYAKALARDPWDIKARWRLWQLGKA